MGLVLGEILFLAQIVLFRELKRENGRSEQDWDR